MTHLLRTSLMKKWFSFALWITPLTAQALDITVAVSGLETDTGGLVVKVYDREDTWLSEDTVLTQRIELNPGDQEKTLEIPLQLEPGSYALSVHHDVNDNKKLDSNFIGIPNEPVGLSNGHRPKFGPPRFKKAVLTIDSDQRIEISLQ